MSDEKVLSRKEIINELWRRGNLSYLLKGKQIDIYNAVKNAEEHITVIAASRRIGKSYTLCVAAIETCLKKSNSIVKYAAPTKIQVEEIITKIMRNIFDDCPPSLRPEWKEAKKKYLFQNGSEIQIAATDGGNIETLRGGAAELCIIDEAGFASDLSYCVDSVMSPTTDTTGGKIILASTPNGRDINHEFNVNYMIPRIENETLLKLTIYDSPMLSPEKIIEIEERYGKDSQKFKTEYLCEIALDQELMVIPEFIEKEIEVVREVQKPHYFSTYVSMDPGFKDLTAVLFAWYDFRNSTIVIDDELIINGASLTTENLASLIREKEQQHFKNLTNIHVEPTLRVADNNSPILVNDLYRLHNILFTTTAKDNKDAAINEVRLRFQQGRIVIHPRCINLRYHLRSCKWDKRHVGFARVKGDKKSGLLENHSDAVDALIYLVRNVQTYLNPYPDNFGTPAGNGFHSNTNQYQGSNTTFGKTLKQLMNMKIGRKS